MKLAILLDGLDVCVYIYDVCIIYVNVNNRKYRNRIYNIK